MVLKWLARGALGTFFVLSILFWPAEKRDFSDLGAFLHSGASYRLGLNPYAHNSIVFPPRQSNHGLNLNPPISVYAFAPLSQMGPDKVRDLFLWGSMALVAASVGLLMHAYPDKRSLLMLLAVAAFVGVRQLLLLQQIYAPLMLAMVCAWLAIKHGNGLLAGVFLGLVIAIKPQFALLALALVAAGHGRVALASLATAGGISLVPLLIDGPVIYRQWLELVTSHDQLARGELSLTALFSRAGAEVLGRVLALAMVGTFMLWARRFRPEALEVASIGVLLIVLVSPASWPGYALFVLPAIFARSFGRWEWLCMTLLAIPLIFVTPGMWGPLYGQLTIGAAYVWALLILLGIYVKEAYRRVNVGIDPVGSGRLVASDVTTPSQA